MLKQFSQSVISALVVTLTFFVVSSAAFAQLSPPISPWMGMLDRDRSPGSLDNYNRVVKPQQDMMKAYAAQQSQMQSQQKALQALQNGSGGGNGGSGTGARDLAGATAASPGAAGNMLLSPPREIPSTQRNPAGFNQYLHYYPQNSLPRRPVPNFSQVGRRR